MSETNRTDNLPIYLDYQATTPVDPSVISAMVPFFNEAFGNSHSTSHVFGWQAEKAVSSARQRVADSIGAEAEEVLFTSGATEAINTALSGLVSSASSDAPHIVSIRTEHKAALATLERIKANGCDVTLLDVDADGLVAIEQVAAAITGRTVLVSVMAVNNEIGVIQPINGIAKLCERQNVAFHTDLAQALGRVPINVGRSRIGLASLSAHKIYGPMGIGALYCRKDLQHKLRPLIVGGGQEQGLRSGTVPVPLAVGFGEAATLVDRRRTAEAKRLTAVGEAFLTRLRSRVSDCALNGSATKRVAGSFNIHFPGIDAEALLSAMPQVAISLGSACSSAAPEPSHVLQALGLNYDAIMGSIRVSFGAPTSTEDALFAADHIGQAAQRLRSAA